MDSLIFFIYLIFPPLVIVFGLLGNLLGLIVLSRSRMSKLQVKNYYRFLFVSDSVFLSEAVISYMQYGLNYDPTITSIYFCKIFNYLNYSLSTISPLLIVFISSERLISIKFSTKANIFYNIKFQLLYLIIITVYSLSFYSGIAIYFDLVDVNISYNETMLQCTFVDAISLEIMSWMDLINRAVVPSIIMVACSILLSISIFRSRKRVNKNHSITANRNFKRDMRYTVTSILLNLVYVLLNMPISITIFLPNYQTSAIYVFSFFLFYLSYGINFYIIVLSNSMIRIEFYSIFNLFNNKVKPTTEQDKSKLNASLNNSSLIIQPRLELH